jgi:8-oxo-dGTP pyrophosphatase MutT (NUDIX family)
MGEFRSPMQEDDCMVDEGSPGRNETLEELLADPIVWLVMKSDSVTEQEILEILRSASRKLGSDEEPVLQHMDSERESSYRPGVGIMLLNARNEVLVGRRNDVQGEAWQMPQGGIDVGEIPREAAFRELKEEISTDNADILAESKEWLYYDFPEALLKKAKQREWRGQRQKWFVMRFRGRDSDIAVATKHPEFSDWKWVSVDDLQSMVVSFKRNVYLSVLAEFRNIVAPLPEPPSA